MTINTATNSRENLMNVKIILMLSMIHFIGDFYASFINPLLPVFVEKYSLTLAQVGLIAAINRLLAFLVQPTVGYFADHYRTRFFILGGPLLSALFIPLTGIAPSYWTLLFFIMLGSVGTSMFHPSTAGMISTYSGNKFGLSMSIFNTGGTFAFTLGPLFITTVVASYGLEKVPYTMFFGFLVLIYLYKNVPYPQIEGMAEFGFLGSLKEVFGKVWKPVLLIWIIMVLRAYVGQSIQTFTPVMIAQEGYQLTTIGFISSFMVLAGTISGIITGHLSDKIGFKPIIYVAHALMPVCILLLVNLRGPWLFLGAFATGFSIMATLPLGVTMAQKIAPKGKSMVSSLMMGLAFGLGGMMSPITGKLADMYSIKTVMSCIAFIPLLTLIPLYFVPEPKN